MSFLSTLSGHENVVRSVAWSPDGHRIASSSDDSTIKIWDAEIQEYECLKTLRGHTGSVRSVAWSPDGQKIASSSYDTTIKIWDIETSVRLSTLSGHKENVMSDECCLVTNWT